MTTISLARYLASALKRLHLFSGPSSMTGRYFCFVGRAPARRLELILRGEFYRGGSGIESELALFALLCSGLARW